MSTAKEIHVGGSRVSRLLDDLAAVVREQVEYREVLFSLTRRDLILRYKETLLGFGWAVLGPSLHMLVFTVIFTRVAPLETQLPYPIFAYSGLLPWALFASGLQFSAASLIGNPSLITKVYFPREIIPFSAVLVALVDFAVASTILCLLMVVYGVPLSWTVLLVPIVVVVQLTFTAGVALLLAMANLFYRDVKHLIGVVLSVWMLATSVVYPVERVGGWLGKLLLLNPMTPIIESYRAVLLRGELPDAGTFAAVTLVSFVTLGIGWIVFHRAEPRFPLRI